MLLAHNKRVGSKLLGPQNHDNKKEKRKKKEKNHTGSSNRREVLLGFERHRKLEDLVRPLQW